MTGRQPIETPPRIAPLPNLPLFYKLGGRKAVVVGNSDGAEWKAELLAAAGAQVTRLTGGWKAEELEGAAFVIADLGERNEALSLIDAAHAAGALVNIIDQTELCDVQFGTIVNRNPVVVAISTDGAAPMLGQSIRARIESVIPLGLSDWACAAKRWRPLLKRRVPGFAERRHFWERFVGLAWRNAARAPENSDFEVLLTGEAQTRGRVTLVGAGPGDPELLTLRAVRALQAATVILYDDLVSPDVLELARREATRIAVGKRGHDRSCGQAEINAQLVELALAGEDVVRLKGGDPMIFGRATEEITACREAGVEVSVVPGISAAQGAAASLQISLTERWQARRVQFVTGHGAEGKLPADIDWLSVADRKVTTVLYMPRKTLGEFVRKALAKGLDASTPAVAIASATLPQETRVAGAVHEIDELATGLSVGAPVTVIIGRVARRLVPGVDQAIPFSKAVGS